MSKPILVIACIVCLIAVLFCCQSPKTPAKPVVKAGAAIAMAQAKDTITGGAELTKGDIDTAAYNNLPYYDTSMGHNYGQGYKDTFSVAGTQFRLIHNDTLFDGTLEKFDRGHWVVQWVAEVLGNHNDYDRTCDLNGDGYNDFIFYWKWSAEVYFFDPAKKAFSDTANCSIGREWETLDAARHIYYEVNEGKLLDPVESNLFTFAGFNRLDLLSLVVDFDKEKDDQPVTTCTLSIPNTGKPAEKTRPAKKINIVDFDYDKFWKEHLKDVKQSH